MWNTVGVPKAELSTSGVNVEESPTAEGSSNRGKVGNGVKFLLCMHCYKRKIEVGVHSEVNFLIFKTHFIVKSVNVFKKFGKELVTRLQ